MFLLLDEANADFVRGLAWDGTGGTSSSNVIGCRFCDGFEFDRGRLGLGTSPPCSGRCSEFARLRWDECEAALATGTAGASGDRGGCDISCLVVVVAGGETSVLLGRHPIVRREDTTRG